MTNTEDSKIDLLLLSTFFYTVASFCTFCFVKGKSDMLTYRWLALSMAGLVSFASFALQSQPAIDKRVAVLETRVGALEKLVTVPKLAITAPALNQQQTDDLGLKYALLIDSKDFQILEWTAFVGQYDRIEFSGVAHLLPEAEPIKDVAATLRVYNKADKLIDVQDIVNVGYRLEPGGQTRFPAITTADKSAIGRYTVEFKLIR